MVVAIWSAILLAQAGVRAKVAPWDIPDALSPDFGLPVSAPRLTDPPGLVRVDGTKATLPDGMTVELLAIGRRRWSHESYVPPILLDAQPAWRPDGSPYLGQGPTEHPIRNVLRAHPVGGLMTPYGEGKEFDDRGARYLAFRFSGVSSEELDIDGLVPETARQGDANPARHGREVPVRLVLPEDGRLDYETEIVVDDTTASHYRLAAAAGEWKTVATVPLNLSAFRFFPDPKTPLGKTVIVHGEWGSLVQDASDYDHLRGVRGYSGPGPRLQFSVEQTEPRRLATRLRFVDANGKGELLQDLRPWNDFRPVCIEVEARPYAWIEFSNVHYDPDPAKWPAAYWGAEGEKAEIRNRGARLRAIFDPTVFGKSLLTTHVYAPDGKLWRAFPDPDAVRWGWLFSKEQGEGLFASLTLDQNWPKEEGWIQIEPFAASSDRPGVGLGETLAEMQSAARGTSIVPFRRPDAAFVQFRIDYPLPWRTIGEILPLSKDEIGRAVRTLSADPQVSRKPDGSLNLSVFVLASAEGHADLWSTVPPIPPRHNLVRWSVKEPGTLARVVIRTRMGVQHIVQGAAIPGLFYATSAGPLFELNAEGDLVYQSWEGSPQKAVPIFMKDVAAFEIQTMDFKPPVFLPARIPPSAP